MFNRENCYTCQIICLSMPEYPTKLHYWKVFLPICDNISEQNCLDKLVYDNLSGFNYFSLRNNTVTNKIKHFHQLFALGPQIP